MSETERLAKPGTTKAPIVNCHVHIFTGDHVPARLARKVAPWPLYWLIDIRLLLLIMKRVERVKKLFYHTRWQNLKAAIGQLKNAVARLKPLAFALDVINAWLAVHALFFLLDGMVALGLLKDEVVKESWVGHTRITLEQYHLFLPIAALWLKVFIGAYVMLLLKWARRLTFQVLKGLGSFLGKIPGAQIKELWSRYRLIIKFSMYGVDSEENANGRSGQASVLRKLGAQYPDDTHFVILPMDMEYMGAGPVGKKGRFEDQMQELVELKRSPKFGERLHPFIFIDPRRIREKGKTFFNWKLTDGRVELLPCAIKEYLDAGLCGFKIYPALGYYPFEEDLLPLWAFAAQEGIPIMSHCIRGTIFYRGNKIAAWDHHPVLMRQTGKDAADKPCYSPLPLLQTRNFDLQENFTHPLNYLCLLNEDLLHLLVAKCEKPVQELFGYSTAAPLTRNLSQLKICMAHFGGDDEWHRHMESDTNNFNQQLTIHPHRGLDFDICVGGVYEWNRLEKHWKEVDWYTIICSLIQQYPNVYADISYILHEEKIRPLLVKTLDHPQGRLPDRVLFGTDFYVVRNHNSDKELLAEMKAGLSETHFDRIARENPIHYYTCNCSVQAK